MVKHSSKPVSGRVWKDKKDCRFSALNNDKGGKSSFDKKMVQKKEAGRIKELMEQIKSEHGLKVA